MFRFQADKPFIRQIHLRFLNNPLVSEVVENLYEQKMEQSFRLVDGSSVILKYDPVPLETVRELHVFHGLRPVFRGSALSYPCRVLFDDAAGFI